MPEIKFNPPPRHPGVGPDWGKWDIVTAEAHRLIDASWDQLVMTGLLTEEQWQYAWLKMFTGVGEAMEDHEGFEINKPGQFDFAIKPLGLKGYDGARASYANSIVRRKRAGI